MIGIHVDPVAFAAGLKKAERIMSRRDVLTKAIDPPANEVTEELPRKPGKAGWCEVCGEPADHAVRDQRQIASGIVQPTPENKLTKPAAWSQRVSEDHRFCDAHTRKARNWMLDGTHTEIE